MPHGARLPHRGIAQRRASRDERRRDAHCRRCFRPVRCRHLPAGENSNAMLPPSTEFAHECFADRNFGLRLVESAVLVRILSACRRPLHRRLVESEKPTASPQRSPETRSFDLEIHRRCFSAVLFDLILDLLPLVERAQSSTFDCRDVDKHVSAAALRLNKSIALSRIEPLHRAARHCRSPN
jgi:hypothetical protein